MSEYTVLQPIHLGSGEQGEARKRALEQIAEREGFTWGGSPSIGRWLISLADREIGTTRIQGEPKYRDRISERTFDRLDESEQKTYLAQLKRAVEIAGQYAGVSAEIPDDFFRHPDTWGDVFITLNLALRDAVAQLRAGVNKIGWTVEPSIRAIVDGYDQGKIYV